MSNVSIGAIDQIDGWHYQGEFKLPIDGKMGLSFTPKTGTGKHQIASPIYGLVAKAKKPSLTIYQKP